jgi:hypothetical protein
MVNFLEFFFQKSLCWIRQPLPFLFGRQVAKIRHKNKTLAGYCNNFLKEE